MMTKPDRLTFEEALEAIWNNRYVDAAEGLKQARLLWDEALTSNDALGAVKAQLTLGQMCIYSGDIEDAMTYGKDGLKKLDELCGIDTTIYHMKAHNFVGTTYLMGGNFGEALQHYNRAFKCSEVTDSDPYRMCVYHNLGEFYRGILMENERALSMYKLAFSVSEEFPQPLTSITIAGAALCHASLNNIDLAKDYVYRAKAYLDEELPTFIRTLLTQFLANAFEEMSFYEEAVEMCQYGIRIMRDRSDDYTRLNLLLILAQSFLGLGLNKKAILATEHCLRISSSHFNDSILLTAYKVLGAAYGQLEMWEESSKYTSLSLEYTIKEMQIKVERQTAVLTSDLKYKTMEKDLEIHRLKNVALKEQKEKLQQTTKELQDTLDILTETQTHLIQSEKLAALGELVAGVSHEINTPLGVGISVSSFVQETLHTITKKLKDKVLSKNQLDELLERSNEALVILIKSLNRAANIINTFKQVAVDQYAYESRWFNVRQYLEDIVTITAPMIKSKAHKITINCPEDLEILSFPGALYQGVVQLIDNAAAHAFEDNNNGNINIDIQLISSNPGRFTLLFKDDGKGISKEASTLVFNPFYTTKKSKGHIGLGLHTLYNLVTQIFEGDIGISSEIDKGTVFNISFEVSKYRYGSI